MNSQLTSPRIVALVPMRHNSSRVPGKNYRRLGDRPLYHHIVKALLDCPLISEVCIDTDSPIILEDAPKHFDVTLLERPTHLRSEFEPMNNIILHDVSKVPADFYLQTHSTNPLLQSRTITRAIEAFLEPGDHDSLVGVTRMQTRLFTADFRPINHDPNKLERTQDLAPLYEENSTIYLFQREILERRGNRIGFAPKMFEVEREQAVDIDEEFDFTLAEFLFVQRNKFNRSKG